MHYVLFFPCSSLFGLTYFSLQRIARTDRKLVLTGFEILGVVVDDNFGNTGKGNSFMETAIQNAKTKGFRTIDVAVFTDNTNMLVLVIKINLNP
jgi:predicted GNAT family acetyltransferase